MRCGDFCKYKGFSQLIAEACGVLFGADSDLPSIVAAILQKRQSGVICRCLDILKPQYYVIEDEYIDRDFMEDYSHYYSRCFKQYPRTCCRVHFFGFGVGVEEIKGVLLGVEDDRWRDRLDSIIESYLGFIVLRPLPPTVYSRICLRPVLTGDAALATTEISVHLFGATLQVRTIPFQEQDSVVAACATSALWSAFQITGRQSPHCIPSPHRITRVATEGGACESRAFPSKGLTIGEIGRAIFKMGLSQQSLSTYNQEMFRAEVYAYLRLGIPLILCGTIREPGKKRDSENWHAVTIVGFHIPEGDSGVSCGNVFVHGAAIDRLYCHDDRLGPFFEFVGEPENRDDDNKDGAMIKWKTYERKRVLMSDFTLGNDYERFTVKSVIAPVYHKLRIGLTDVLDELELLNEKILVYLEEVGFADKFDIHHMTWDLYLSSSVDLKKRSRNASTGLDGQLVAKICSEPMPKYVWVASAFEKDRRLGTFLVDATGIAQDIDVFTFIEGEDGFKAILYSIAKMVVDSTKCMEPRVFEEDTDAESCIATKYLIAEARNPFIRHLISLI